jgi:hypothetical protein
MLFNNLKNLPEVFDKFLWLSIKFIKIAQDTHQNFTSGIIKEQII